MHEACQINLLLISVVFLVPFCDYSFHRNCNTIQSFCIRNVRSKLENAIFLMVRCKYCEIQFVNKKSILHSSRCIQVIMLVYKPLVLIPNLQCIDLGDLTGKTVSCMHEACQINLLLISVVFLVPFCDYSFHRNCNTIQSFCIRNVRSKLENAIFLMVRCKYCEIQFVNKKSILHSSRCIQVIMLVYKPLVLIPNLQCISHVF